MAQRIGTPNKDTDKFGAGKHGFQDEILGVQAATEFSSGWCDHLQEEVANVVEGFGGALNPVLRNQMYTAIVAAIAAGTPDASTTVKGKSELATAAEAQGLADLVRVLTPGTLDAAFKAANQSLAASGYQKLPGGLILQWGSGISSGTGVPNVVWTFPVAFPTACIYCDFISISNSQQYQSQLSSGPTTTTGNGVLGTDATRVSGLGYLAFAIGY